MIEHRLQKRLKALLVALILFPTISSHYLMACAEGHSAIGIAPDTLSISFKAFSISRDSVEFEMQSRLLVSENHPPSLMYCIISGKSTFAAELNPYDPDWILTYTDGEEKWAWSIAKRYSTNWTAYQPLNSPFSPIFLFPLESFDLEFYVLSDKPELEIITTVSNPSFIASAVMGQITLSEVPENIKSHESIGYLFSEEYLEYAGHFICHFTINLRHPKDFGYFIILLYLMLVLISIIVGGVIYHSIRSGRFLSRERWFEGYLTILLFLPIFLFTYRTSYAPPWITLFDIWTVILLLLWSAYFIRGIGLGKSSEKEIPRL